MSTPISRPGRLPNWWKPRRVTVRALLAAVAVVALLLGCIDQVRTHIRVNEYRRAIANIRRLEAELRDMPLCDRAMNRNLLSAYSRLRQRYEEAAAHPRRPFPPVRPGP